MTTRSVPAGTDGTGRRPILLWGSFAFAGTSLACAVAPTGLALVAARLLQGFAAGGGVAAGRAVVTDHYVGREAAKRFGTIASVTLLAPIVAPPIGSVIVSVGSWRTVFVALALVSALFYYIRRSRP